MKRTKAMITSVIALVAVLALAVAFVSAREIDETSILTQEDGNTLVDVVVRAANANPSQFNFLLAAVQAADPAILEALSDPDLRLTVFAPSDAAFEALPEEVLDVLLQSPDLLTEVLLYHVLPIRVTSNDVLGLLEANNGGFIATTLLGEDIEVTSNEAGIFLNQSALRVVGGLDFFASNGVIHIIERVLLPPDFDEKYEQAVVDLRATNIASAADRLRATSAPAAEPEVEEEEPEEIPLPGEEEITSAVDRLRATAPPAAEPEVEEEVEEVALPGEEEISAAVDRLTGTAAEGETGELTIAEIAVSSEDFETLVLILVNAAPDYLEALSDPDGEFTVFAPTDDAFDALGAGLGIEIESALVFPDILIDILGYHVIEGAVPSDVVVTLDGEFAETIQGESIEITVTEEGVVLNGVVNVVVVDIFASNGVIHVIDAVLLPQSAIETLRAFGLNP